MKTILGLLFVFYCVAADNTIQKNVEPSKQEKRSLSHGAFGFGLPGSIQSSPSVISSGIPSTSIVSGPSAVLGDSSAVLGDASAVLGGSSTVLGGSSGVFGGSPAVLGGSSTVLGGSSAVGVSTNTNTLTTIKQNVPVPVYQPYPVIR